MKVSRFAMMVLFFVQIAAAAQPARVDQAGVKLLDGPGKHFTTLAKLPKGSALSVSNYPTQGYYKVRTQKGKIGWVDASSIAFPKREPMSDSNSEMQDLDTGAQ